MSQNIAWRPWEVDAQPEKEPSLILAKGDLNSYFLKINLIFT